MAAYTVQELKGMITVNMGDYKTGRGGVRLITRDLGSCVGIALRDPKTGVGGLLHIMLPRYVPDKAGEHTNPARYADIGTEAMVKDLLRMGAKKERLVAKIAGAAHMFNTNPTVEKTDISSKNLSAVQAKLAELGIPVLASDAGEHLPRTVVFEPGSGTLEIVIAGKIAKVL